MADTASQQAPKTPQSIQKKSPAKNPIKTPSEAPKTPEMPSKVEDAPSQVADTATETNGGDETNGEHEPSEAGQTEDNKTETAGIPEESPEEEEEEEGDEAIQAGSVDREGNVVNEAGEIIGHVNGDEISHFEGSVVDQEGDIIDEEGNVIGQANLTEAAESAKEGAESAVEGAPDAESAKEGAESAVEGAPDAESAIGSAKEGAESAVGTVKDDAESAAGTAKDGAESAVGGAKDAAGSVAGSEKPELDGPFGVQDNGEVTNATGVPIGKLVQGEPQDLVGTSIKDIDSEGNLVKGSGSIVGKADIGGLAPEEAAPSDVGSKAGEKLDEAAPTEAGSKVDAADGAADELAPSDAVDEAGAKVEGAPTEVGSKVDETGDKLDEAAPTEAGSKLDEPEAAADEAAPTEVGSKVDGAAATEFGSKVGSKVDDAEAAVDEAAPTEVGSKVDGPAATEVGSKVDDAEGAVDDAAPTEVGSKLDEPEAALDGAEPKEGEEQLDEDGNKIEGAVPTEVGEEGAEVAPTDAGEEVADDAEAAEPEDLSVLDGKILNKLGKAVDENGTPWGVLVEGDAKKLAGKKVDGEGKVWDDSGKNIGRVELLPESERPDKLTSPFEDFPDAVVDKNGNVIFEGQLVGKLVEGDAKTLAGKKVDADGDVLDKHGNVLGKAERSEEAIPEPEAEPEAEDLSVLEGKRINKAGKAVDENGTPWGVLVEGDAKKLAGKKVDGEGKIWDDSGKVVGRVELLPESERPDKLSSPFEDFPDAMVDKNGNVIFEGQVVGKLIEGDAKTLAGKKIDADGDVLDKFGNVLGKAERYEEEEVIPEPEPEPEVEDLSILEGKKVNKAGNIVDDNGKLFGRLATGDASKLIGKKVGADGNIFSESGKVIGTAELLPMDDRDVASDSPFEDFPGATVDKNGHIIYDSVIVGRLIEGDAKKLLGKKVDPDGDIVDKIGNVVGKAERWEEEEAPPEPEAAPIDMSALAGKRVNKVGNLVDSAGQIYGRLAEGDLKRLVGKMADKNGQIWDEGGNVIGRAELVPESERDGLKEGPFAGFDDPVVTKDGKVADAHGAIIGRVIEGDIKKLYGKLVDPDGDILDSNGNSKGKAERWEEEEEVKSKHPAAGRKVNKKGEVVDDDGDTIAKLTDGDLGKCAGNKIDDDGDVVDGKGTTIGHVTLLADIPEPEPEPEPEVEEEEEPVEEEPQETEEEIAERKQLEEDKKLAGQLAGCIEQSIDKIKPVLKMITHAIDVAEAQPKEELDEQKLVDTVKPLIEEGAGILQECNGVIRGLDPDGRISSGAKAHAAAREATSEEYRLADLLKELSAGVQTTIDNAKKKIAGMPHAKKELNPLWNLLAEPLGQIIAAVGLLLSGVLGLVGRLLSGLGLGGLLDNLLGGLGLKGILKGLGLGMVTESLTGKKN